MVLIGSVQATEKANQKLAKNPSMALAKLLRKADAEPDVDTLRACVRVMTTQALMELEVAMRVIVIAHLFEYLAARGASMLSDTS